MNGLRNEKGYMAVWTLVVIGLFVGGIGLLVFSGPSEVGVIEGAIYITALIIAVAGIIFEARSDFFGAAKFMIVFSAFGGVIAFAVAAHSVNLGTIGMVCAASFAVLFLSNVTFVVWTQFRPGSLPNVLREEYKSTAIRELDGVQMVFDAPAKVFLTDQPAAINIVIQNCWDAPRTITIVIKEDRRIFFGKSGTLLYPAETLINLGPAEVVHGMIPFSA